MTWREPERHAEEGHALCTYGECQEQAVRQHAVPAPTEDDPERTVPAFACADHDEALPTGA